MRVFLDLVGTFLGCWELTQCRLVSYDPLLFLGRVYFVLSMVRSVFLSRGSNCGVAGVRSVFFTLNMYHPVSHVPLVSSGDRSNSHSISLIRVVLGAASMVRRMLF